jgi:hypothetical protein
MGFGGERSIVFGKYGNAIEYRDLAAWQCNSNSCCHLGILIDDSGRISDLKK